MNETDFMVSTRTLWYSIGRAVVIEAGVKWRSSADGAVQRRDVPKIDPPGSSFRVATIGIQLAGA